MITPVESRRFSNELSSHHLWRRLHASAMSKLSVIIISSHQTIEAPWGDMQQFRKVQQSDYFVANQSYKLSLQAMFSLSDDFGTSLVFFLKCQFCIGGARKQTRYYIWYENEEKREKNTV